MSFQSYRNNRLMGFGFDALRRFYRDAEAYEAIYKAERCNNTASGFDCLCDRLQCQRERKCQRAA